MFEQYVKNFGIEDESAIASFKENFWHDSFSRTSQFFMPLRDIEKLREVLISGNEYLAKELGESISSYYKYFPSSYPNGTVEQYRNSINVIDFLKAYDTLKHSDFDFSFISKDTAIFEQYGFSKHSIQQDTMEADSNPEQ